MYKKMVMGLLVAFFGPALAADEPDVPDPRWYFSPMVGYLHTDKDRDAENGPTGYLGLGKPVSKHVNVEMHVQGTNVNRDGSGQYKFRGAGLDGLLFFSRHPGFAPYAVVGASALTTEIRGEGRSTNPAAEAGLGFFSQAFGDTSLRGDVRHRAVFDNDTVPGESRFDDWIASVGIAIPIGNKPAPPPEPAPVAQAEGPAAPAPKTVRETVILEGVNFCFDCYHLSDQAKQILDTNARKVIDANVENDIEIAGHTDSIGTDEYNLGLSQRRVDSVREYLVEQGVDGARLTAKGYGEAEPIAENDTPEGRAKNRRVELRVME